ncbi:hypothetical protein B0H66DRAFT_53048 [Apodospora peruviana]|uniref:Uncharacterized protein n=1 Tax=Apodospora peruviana TaxID=516989 RepID=A0AAE0ISL8_9PEZI|nr:hypothetical protein B0H66DRAFT_53048 [Apodospora peruviana]
MAPGETAQHEQLTVVETATSPSSDLALSRFEFEKGKGNEGTKILMIEWDISVFTPPSAVASKGGAGEKGESGSDWDISWESKGAVVPIRDAEQDPTGATRRLYFLLPPGSPIPPLVTIARKGGVGEAPGKTVLRTKPLPAIFPAELGGGREAGQRGVLHTIWAKKRLSDLDTEITEEMKANGESVGLEMAMQERQRILDHFLTPGEDMVKPTKLYIPQNVLGPASPRSPIGGKLGEKLRGLKLATSPAELAAATQASKSAHPRTQSLVTNLSANPAGAALSALPNLGNQTLPRDSGGAGVASLDAIVGSGMPPAKAVGEGGDDPTEEDLFALPMSPRSPEMKRSPFSLL